MLSDIETARARSVAYNAVAELLLPPSPDLEEAVASGVMGSDLEQAAKTLNVDAGPLIEKLAERVRTPGTDREALSRQHMRVFGPTLGQDFAPYSTEYDPNGKFRKEHELADIAGFYCAWGLEVNGELHERVDHFGIEADYLAFMALKEAYARINDEPDRATEVRKTADRFAAQYVAAAAGEFFERISRADDGGLITAAAGLLLELLSAQGIPTRGQPRIVSLPVVESDTGL